MASFTRYTDPALNTFKKTNMYYETDPFIKYQDPLYIGFKLFFTFDQVNCGLLSSKPLKNTALGYLDRIGDVERAEYLKRFVDLLKKLNERTPWFFQQIDGLDDAWKHMYQEKDYKPKLNERKIIINCLEESVDMRITALMDLYRKACFDWPNRREVVPQNLRRFKVKIYCYEGRSLNRYGLPWAPENPTVTPSLNKEDPITPTIKNAKKEMDTWFGKDENAGSNSNSYKKDFLNDNISRVMFDFNFCEWLPDESGVVFSGISNKDFNIKAQKISFSYENVEEDNIYRFFHDKKVTDMIIHSLDGLALDNPSNLPPNGSIPGDPPGYLEKLTASLKTVAEKFKLDLGIRFPLLGNVFGKTLTLDIVQQAILDKAEAKLKSLLLGNVYGVNPAGNLAALQNGGLNGVLSGLMEIGKNASLKNSGTDSNSIGTIDKGVSVSNDNGPDAGKANPFTAQVFFDDFLNKSLNNDKNSNPATSQGSITVDASLGNEKGSNPATSQGSIIVDASLSNEKNSNPATSQGAVTVDASLSNDNGPDATSQGLGPNNASLSNDKNSNPATSQGAVSVDTSLQNDKNSNPATSQGSVIVDSSLTNMKGSNPATSQTPADSRASLSNDDGPDATSQGASPENVSLNNDDGSDSTHQGASPQVSKSNLGGKASGNAYK